MCSVNPDINKGGTSFAFQPPGCTVGTSCTGVRALVLALDNVCPICARESTTDCPNLPTCPVTLYTCTIAIATGATAGDKPLTCSNAGASDPSGGAVTANCTDGKVTVSGGGPTATVTGGAATATSTPAGGTPTRTGGAVGTPTVTRTGGAVGTPTRTSIIPPPFRTSDDDACAIASPANSASGWALLLPLAALLWVRRRSR